MTTHFYYGDDEFSLEHAVQKLREGIDPFNYTHVRQQKAADLMSALETASTGTLIEGMRLVWVENCVLNNDLMPQLECRSENTHLVLSSSKPLDLRSKVGKYVQKVAEVRAFSLVSPWREDLLAAWVKKVAVGSGLQIETAAITALVAAVGNQSRQLHHELEKLSLCSQGAVITAEMVRQLVTASAQNSLDLCQALLHQRSDEAIGLIQGLLAANEHSLKILKTVSSQFRMWLHVQSLIEDGEVDDVIAAKAGIGNPSRLFYIRKELKGNSTQRLEDCLSQILDAEYRLKLGGDEEGTLRDLAMEMRLEI